MRDSLQLARSITLAPVASSGLCGYAQTASVAEELPEANEAPQLDLETLEHLALEHNPTLVQAGAQVRISRGKALQAGLAPNPNVGYVAEQIGADGTAGEMQGIFFEQQIITGGKLELSRAKYLQEARQAELQVLAQRFRILQSVRLGYYEILIQQRRLDLRRRLLENAEETNKTLAELVNVGQANQTDLLQSQVELGRSRANLRRQERKLQGAWEELTAVIGMPELMPSPLEDRLDFASVAAIDRET